ncbi:hypothetical protein [Streptosporangium sp. KLBMP 9127]|nr:hypothetical protein [Streptosporangium sp. KLBMP 9127]
MTISPLLRRYPLDAALCSDLLSWAFSVLAVLDLIHRARQDAESQERDRAAASLGTDNSLIADRQKIADELRHATGTLQENLRHTAEMIERLQRLRR